ncbi:hypothetical protein [Pseudobutyrivibrio xylanivorans]|uniref:hypothetical protein n=1 Tax=Pseudobutyrivibrio xylanivorans TaxID=185007 RepID=UPI00124D8556|nr:hypothetical protein [Pseudobutyrivibrio xylanivorans]
MSMPMTLVLPLLLCFMESIGLNKKYLCGILGAILLYGNIYAVGTDIDALAQGSTSSYSIMNNIVGDIADSQLISDEYEYAFFGNIGANVMFKKNELYGRADAFAKFGTMMTKPDMVHKSYIGLVDDIGINLEIVDNDTYLAIYNSGILDTMPAYPEEGSIIEKNGVVIVKVSEDYKWK